MDPKEEHGKEALRLIRTERATPGDGTDARRTARIAEAQVYATLEVANQINLLRSENEALRSA